MKLENKNVLKEILLNFGDELFKRYYITHPPQITKSDNVSMGYGDSVLKPKQSIHFRFKTEQPNRDEVKNFIKVFVETLEI
tara:strand:- start:499 stop:741 length:243 start_codon:yes stop_codon:yes gene_type:complete